MSTAHRSYPAVFKRIESQSLPRDENGDVETLYRELPRFFRHSLSFPRFFLVRSSSIGRVSSLGVDALVLNRRRKLIQHVR